MLSAICIKVFGKISVSWQFYLFFSELARQAAKWMARRSAWRQVANELHCHDAVVAPPFTDQLPMVPMETPCFASNIVMIPCHGSNLRFIKDNE